MNLTLKTEKNLTNFEKLYKKNFYNFFLYNLDYLLLNFLIFKFFFLIFNKFKNNFKFFNFFFFLKKKNYNSLYQSSQSPLNFNFIKFKNNPVNVDILKKKSFNFLKKTNFYQKFDLNLIFIVNF